MTAPSFNHNKSFPVFIRYPVLVLTYVLLKPLLWLIDRTGYADRFWAAVGRDFAYDAVWGSQADGKKTVTTAQSVEQPRV